MVVKSIKTKESDDLSYWNRTTSLNNNEIENIDNEDRSIAFSVNLLLKNKNISQPNLVQLPSHLVTSENCQCHRSFHLFCTDLFPKNDQDIDMIHIHPAPRIYERDSSRRVSTPYKKYHHRSYLHRYKEDNDQDFVRTTRSEPVQTIIPENQLLEKKLVIPSKISPRTTSLNIPSTYHSFQRTLQTSIKYFPSNRIPKQTTTTTSNTQLHVRTLSGFDQSPATSQLFTLRGPPPSPKTPTQESSMILLNSIIPTAPLRTLSIIPQVRNSNENEKKPTNTSSTSVKITNYKDHAREYLSASDCSDNDKDANDKHDDNDNNNNDEDDEDDEDDDDDINNKDLNELLTITKPKLPARNQSLSRSGTTLRDRLLSHHANRYFSLAEIYYSSLDVYKNIPDKTRRRLRSQRCLIPPTNENDDAATTITKTTKTTPISQSKSVFGFSKTASSMHFGHAAGRLGLHGSFEKWPRPISRRTPIERKQEVTTLRLVTLPLVTS